MSKRKFRKIDKQLFDGVINVIRKNKENNNHMTYTEVGAIFGIHRSTVNKIVMAETWEKYNEILKKENEDRKVESNRRDNTNDVEAEEEISFPDEQNDQVKEEIFHAVGDMIRSLVKIRDALALEVLVGNNDRN